MTQTNHHPANEGLEPGHEQDETQAGPRERARFGDLLEAVPRDLDDRLRVLLSAVANATDAILVTEAGRVGEPSGPRIVYVNEAFTKMTGYSSEEAIGNHVGIVRGPGTSLERLRRLSEHISRGESDTLELLNYRKDGSEFWSEIRVSPVLNGSGQITHHVSIQRDITGRKNDEARLEALMRNLDDIVWIIEPTGEIRYRSPSITRVLGWDSDDLGDNVPFQLLHPDDLEGAKETFMHLLTGSGEQELGVWRIRHKDGGWRQLQVQSSNLIDDPEIRGIVVTAHDITRRIRLEERLRQSQKLEAIGQLAGGIAHDFNNLLSVMQSYARFLTESLPPQSPEAEDAEEIVKAGERAADLVRRLLAFSRRDGSTATVVNVNAAIADLDRLLRRTIGEDIELITRLDDASWWTRINPRDLEQVLMNLAFNARDAMPQGGRLTITTGTVEIGEVAELPPGTYASIVVADTGTGMSEDVMARIFEPFYTTKSRGRGTGLGLATVYGMVKHAAGAIEVSSAPGEGTRFEILLPAIDHEPVDTDPQEEALPRPGNREKVLVVEDEEGVRRLVRRMLERNGYDVVTAASGPEAIGLYERTDGISLLLTDVIMPQMSGRDLAEEITLKSPLTPVIYMSGYPGETLANHGVSESDRSYLQKPFTKEQLLDCVRGALDAEPEQQPL
jgi:PAS domain S-box-containing protein